MNSGAERIKAWALAAAALLGLGLLASCGDRGPTNLYSQPLFGEKMDGARMEVWRVLEDSLSPTAGLDGFVVSIRNNGNGGTVGPITVTMAVPLTYCASTVNYGAALATAVFGSKGQVINPGDILRGQAVDNFGTVQNSQYAYEATLTGCAGTQLSFNLTATDTRGGSWNSSFSAQGQ